MPKDFSQFSANPKNYSSVENAVNPVPVTPAAHPKEVPKSTFQKIRQSTTMFHVLNVLGNVGLSLVTGPLTTTHISMQQAIKAHRSDLEVRSEEDMIRKIPQDLQAKDRKRYEMLIHSRVIGFQKPYEAPVYLSYKEAFQGLANQGMLAFYKGNFLNLLHLTLSTNIKVNAFYYLDHSRLKSYHDNLLTDFAATSGVLTLVDVLLNPIQVAQSRFILQNRLSNFYTYKNFRQFISRNLKDPRTFFLGWTIHYPKNLLASVSSVNLIESNPMQGYLLSNYIAETLVYPLLTVLRRLQCQDATAVRMLHPRYNGLVHAFKLIAQEEGIRGFYRGFIAFSLVQLFTGALVFNTNLFNEQQIDFDFES